MYAYIFGSLVSFVASSLFAYGLFWIKNRKAIANFQNRPFRISDLLKRHRPPVVRVAPHVAISSPVPVHSTLVPVHLTSCRPPATPPPPPSACAIQIAPIRPSSPPPQPPKCAPPPSSLPAPCFKLKPVFIDVQEQFSPSV